MRMRISVLLTILCLLLCGCTTPSPELPELPQLPAGSAIVGGSAELPEDTMTTPYIGLVLKARDNPFFDRMKSGAEEAADALGAQLMAVSPTDETKAEEQEALIHTMAGMAVDVLIADPTGDADLTEALTLAQQNGKILLAVDTAMDFPGCSCYVGTDNYAAAKELGEYAAGLIEPTQTAVILRGPQGDSTHDLREQGLQEALIESGIASVSVYHCDSDEDAAKAAAEQLLQAENPPALICTTADPIALGVSDAAQEMDSPVHIVSFDGLEEVTERILDGTIDAAIAQDAEEIGAVCVQTSIALFRGESVAKTIYVDSELITPETAAAHQEKFLHENTKR